MKLQVLETEPSVLNMHTRMPFRYGIATLTALPHLFLWVRVRVGNEEVQGLAAEHLPPKWFTKDPNTTVRHDLAEMIDVVRAACRHAEAATPAPSVFDLWQAIYDAQSVWGRSRGYPPLLWAFGVSLLERALIDAYVRGTGTTFARALRANDLGLRLGEIHPELAGTEAAALLPERPLSRITVRHTVGLGDPLVDDDIPAAERLEDGLPQSLRACIRAYGLTHFKIKIGGQWEEDRERLQRIARLLEEELTARGMGYAFTLDGNEGYRAVDSLRTLWEELCRESTLADFLGHLLFVEQPLHRDIALSAEVAAELTAWEERPPIIIDESDGELASARQALAAGYVGTSHKNCKGVFKGIANACLVARRNRQAEGSPHTISGEDLSNVGPVALPQDLAVLASLGIEHAERNGHHYFAGLSMLPPDLQAEVLAAHGDLYHAHQGPDGTFPAVAVQDGTIDVGSTVAAPFGYAISFDPGRFTPLDAWQYSSLGL